MTRGAREAWMVTAVVVVVCGIRAGVEVARAQPRPSASSLIDYAAMERRSRLPDESARLPVESASHELTDRLAKIEARITELEAHTWRIPEKAQRLPNGAFLIETSGGYVLETKTN